MTEIATTYGQAMYDLAREEGLTKDLLEELGEARLVLKALAQRSQLGEQRLGQSLVPGQVIERRAVGGGKFWHSTSPSSLMN